MCRKFSDLKGKSVKFTIYRGCWPTMRRRTRLLWKKLDSLYPCNHTQTLNISFFVTESDTVKTRYQIYFVLQYDLTRHCDDTLFNFMKQDQFPAYLHG